MSVIELPATLSNFFTHLGRGIRRVAPRTTQPQLRIGAVVTPSPLTLTASTVSTQPEVLCLAIAGPLNCYTYTLLIDRVAAAYAAGQRALILDLRETTRIELSGLFALHSITRLYAGQGLLNPEGGWAVLHWSAEELTPELGQRVKLLAPAPAVAKILRIVGFDRCVESYDDLDAAVAAFMRTQIFTTIHG
jgi:anti-anti-sigma regulatory factor